MASSVWCSHSHGLPSPSLSPRQLLTWTPSQAASHMDSLPLPSPSLIASQINSPPPPSFPGYFSHGLPLSLPPFKLLLTWTPLSFPSFQGCASHGLPLPPSLSKLLLTWTPSPSLSIQTASHMDSLSLPLYPNCFSHGLPLPFPPFQAVPHH